MRSLILLFLTTLLSAQAEVEITAEPHHHPIFANSQIRVFKVDVPPHSDTLLHWHRHDYIYVTLGDSEVINAVQGKSPVTVTLRDGQTDLLAAPYAHVAHNQSDKPFRNVTVELLQDDQLPTPPTSGTNPAASTSSPAAPKKSSGSKTESAPPNSNSKPKPSRPSLPRPTFSSPSAISCYFSGNITPPCPPR
jgi:hypothetical protein